MTARRIFCAAAMALAFFAAAPADARQVKKQEYSLTKYLPHPQGCPKRAFCACGASVRIFGKAIRSLWPVKAWHRFAADRPAPGNVAIERRRSHLFVLERQVDGTLWEVSDFNSGGHKSRRHLRDIAGLKIVNPHSSRMASQ